QTRLAANVVILGVFGREQAIIIKMIAPHRITPECQKPLVFVASQKSVGPSAVPREGTRFPSRVATCWPSFSVRVPDRGLRVQSQRGSIELRIHKHAEVHEAVPSMFLHQGSHFTGSLAIGDFDSEHVSSFSQHRLIPTYKFGWKITEKPVPLL